jgi:hypothetical protein
MSVIFTGPRLTHGRRTPLRVHQIINYGYIWRDHDPASVYEWETRLDGGEVSDASYAAVSVQAVEALVAKGIRAAETAPARVIPTR